MENGLEGYSGKEKDIESIVQIFDRNLHTASTTA